MYTRKHVHTGCLWVSGKGGSFIWKKSLLIQEKTISCDNGFAFSHAALTHIHIHTPTHKSFMCARGKSGSCEETVMSWKDETRNYHYPTQQKCCHQSLSLAQKKAQRRVSELPTRCFWRPFEGDSDRCFWRPPRQKHLSLSPSKTMKGVWNILQLPKCMWVVRTQWENATVKRP